MASTYTIADALSVANRTMPRAIEADHAAYVANIALNKIWHAYDWRVSLATLPPFWLIPLIQDYGAPFYAVPTDFYGLRQAYLVQTSSTPLPRRMELKVIKNLRKEYLRGLPRDIGYIMDTRSFRVYPQIGENIGSTQFLIDGVYKKLAPQVTSTTLQSTYVPFDDIYLSTFIDALRWGAAQVAGSPDRAAKLQELNQSIYDMANAEGMELGNQVVAPSEGLVGGSGEGYFPGIMSGIF
jgi:hypothetical protein